MPAPHMLKPIVPWTLAAAMVMLVAVGVFSTDAWSEKWSVKRFEHINRLNFYIAPPHNLSLLLSVGDETAVSMRSIHSSLRKVLLTRLTPVKEGTSPPTLSWCDLKPSRHVFSQTGVFDLYLDVCLPGNSMPKRFDLGVVNVWPKVEHSGMAATEAVAALRNLTTGESKFRQVAAALALWFLGAIMIGAMTVIAGRGLVSPWTALLSYPVGLGLWVIASLAVLIVGAAYTSTVMGIVIGLPAILAVAILVFRPQHWPGRMDFAVGFACAATFAAVAVALVHWDLSLLHWDSWRYLYFGKVLAYWGGLSFTDYPKAYGVFPALVQSLSMFIGIKFFAIAQPLLVINALAVASWSLFARMSRDGASPVLSCAFAGLFLAAILPHFLPAAAIIWYLPNAFAASYLMMSLICLDEFTNDETTVSLATAGVTLISFALTRIEGPVACLVVLATLFYRQRPNGRQISLFYAPVAIILTVWYYKIHSTFSGGTSDFLTPAKINLVIGTNIVALLAVLAARRYIVFYALARMAVRKVPHVLILVGVLSAAVRPDTFVNNMLALATNLFVAGSWGAFWLMVAALLFLVPFTPTFRGEIFYRFPLVALALLTVDLFLFRDEWLRVHVMDSGNRQFIHYYMIAAYFLVARFGAAAADSLRLAAKRS